MPFFELPPRSEDDDLDDDLDDGSWDDPTTLFVGGVVPLELILAKSENAAVIARGIVAYPEGFELSLISHIRKPVRKRGRMGFIGGPMMHHWDPDDDDGPFPDEFLRFGVKFPDGGRATNMDIGPWALSPDATEPLHGLETQGGGGGDHRYEQSFWIWPIPEDGDLSIVCEWPAYEIAETWAEIDGQLLRDAAARARAVWASEADRPSRLNHHQLMSTMQLRSPRAAFGSGGFSGLGLLRVSEDESPDESEAEDS